MTELKRFIRDLRELANRDLPLVITLPHNAFGLPEGSYIPKALLNYIADSLDGKLNQS